LGCFQSPKSIRGLDALLVYKTKKQVDGSIDRYKV
jgi:hypothetical protein